MPPIEMIASPVRDRISIPIPKLMHCPILDEGEELDVRRNPLD